MNLTYLIPMVIAFFSTLIITPVLIKYLVKNKISLQQPRDRDVHTKPIPRLGGVVIFIIFWLAVISYQLFYPEKLHFVNEKILGIDKNLLGVFLGSLILVITGIVDDLKNLNPWVKLFWQAIAAVTVVAFGIKILWLANPVGGTNIIINNWTYFLVPIWIILLVNITNWLDGVDGLASGISFITLIVLMFLALTPFVNQPATALLCAILAGAILGFLPFNFNPAKIFLGDSGSMFLGFMIAIAAIISGGKIATTALVLGVPILDAAWVILRRIFSGKSPMKADKFHLHHRFLQAGFSQKQTVIIFYLISALFGIIALQSGIEGKFTAGLWLLAIMVIMGIALIVMRKKNDI